MGGLDPAEFYDEAIKPKLGPHEAGEMGADLLLLPVDFVPEQGGWTMHSPNPKADRGASPRLSS